MSRDKRLNRTQEVDGSSPFSSTNSFSPAAASLLSLSVCPGERDERVGNRPCVVTPQLDPEIRFRTH